MLTIMAAEEAAGAGLLEVELESLLVIFAIATAVPFLARLLRGRIAEVVLLIVGGVLLGPQVAGWIEVDGAINLLSQLGLGFLFFLAGLELEPDAIRGRSGRLAATGWFIALILAAGVTLALYLTGEVDNGLGFAIVLTSTALGTLLPILRDSGELNTPFGTYFMGAGAWGEFGPIIAIAVLLSTQSVAAAIISLLLIGAVALVLVKVPARFTRNARLREVIDLGYHTTSQTGLRLTVLLLVGLLTLAEVTGLDIVLGAFIGGMVLRRYLASGREQVLQTRVEAIAFGVFIPIFFVVSGANLDILSILSNPWPMLAVFVLLLLIRGLPQMVLYRRAIPDLRQRTRFSLYTATALPIIVAVTSILVSTGTMSSNDAAELVGAGVLSVMVFPFIAGLLQRKGAQDERSDATA